MSWWMDAECRINQNPILAIMIKTGHESSVIVGQAPDPLRSPSLLCVLVYVTMIFYQSDFFGLNKLVCLI